MNRVNIQAGTESNWRPTT